MARVASWLFGWGPTLALFVAFCVVSAVYFWPAGWWMRVYSLQAHDTTEFGPLILDLDQFIYRPIQADWTLLVRKIVPTDTGQQRLIVYCQAYGTRQYHPDNSLPDILTISWWTNGQCSTPEPGEYVLTSAWALNPAIGPDKTIMVHSNIFTVEASQ